MCLIIFDTLLLALYDGYIMTNNEKPNMQTIGESFNEADGSEELESLHQSTEKYLGFARGRLSDLLTVKDSIYPRESDYGSSASESLEYSDDEIIDCLSTRHRGTRPYHEETQKYGDLTDDSTETKHNKRVYRNSILQVGIELGFIDGNIKEPSNDYEKMLDCSSEPEVIKEDLEAIVIPTAAGLSNIKRAYHAFKAVASEAIKTDKIVFATCDRQATDAEKKSLSDKGFSIGNTEYELALCAVNDVYGGFVGETTRIEEKVTFRDSDDEYTVRGVSGFVLIDGKKIEVKVVDSPFDKNRKMDDGKPAMRANTEETFYSAATVLNQDGSNKPVCITSHDVWQAHQVVVANRVFGAGFGRNVYGSAPNNCSRLFVDENGDVDILAAEALEDEMSKYLFELEKLERAVYIKQMTNWVVECGVENGLDFSDFETTTLDANEVFGSALSYLYEAGLDEFVDEFDERFNESAPLE